MLTQQQLLKRWPSDQWRPKLHQTLLGLADTRLQFLVRMDETGITLHM